MLRSIIGIGACMYEATAGRVDFAEQNRSSDRIANQDKENTLK
jgi:hypothetical protein